MAEVFGWVMAMIVTAIILFVGIAAGAWAFQFMVTSLIKMIGKVTGPGKHSQ